MADASIPFAAIPTPHYTLDEPVSETIKRDALKVWEKLVFVLFPRKEEDNNYLRDWDLWGPLCLCLLLSIMLSMTSREQASAAFTSVFLIVWMGAGIVTLNSQLLGGQLSFFQSVCVLGYCLCPLVVAKFFCLWIPFLLLRAVLVSGAFAWTLLAAKGFLVSDSFTSKRTLVLYPIGLFYFVISWIIMISKSLFG